MITNIILWVITAIIVIAGIATWFSWASAFVEAGYEFKNEGKDHLSAVVFCIFVTTLFLVAVCAAIVFVMWSLLA